MTGLGLHLIIDRAIIFLNGKIVSACPTVVQQVRAQPRVEDRDRLVVAVRPTVEATVCVNFLAVLAVDSESALGLQDFAACARGLLGHAKDSALLPADVVMHVDEVAAFANSAEVFAAPLVVLLGLRLELGNILRPYWLSMVVVLGELGEDDVDHFSFDALDLALHPALDLLHLFITIDLHVDTVTRLQLLPPNLVRRGQLLKLFVGHLEVPLVQHVIGFEAPGHGTCEILVIPFVLHLMGEEVHECLHRVSGRLNIILVKSRGLAQLLHHANRHLLVDPFGELGFGAHAVRGDSVANGLADGPHFLIRVAEAPQSNFCLVPSILERLKVACAFSLCLCHSEISYFSKFG